MEPAENLFLAFMLAGVHVMCACVYTVYHRLSCSLLQLREVFELVDV